MRNKGQEICYRQTTNQVDRIEWEKAAIKRDALRFEEKVKNDRIRLGLEVSNAN